MIGIVDYNAGNITSLERALNALGAPYIRSKNPRDLENVDRLIFPGDGEAKYAMEQLAATGFSSFIKEWCAAEKPLVGICIGSQIIFDWSEEGGVKCLGLIPGVIRHLSEVWKERLPTEAEHEERAMLKPCLKVPHMGWNDVTFCNGGTRLAEGVRDGSDFYFVHSYVIQPDDPTVIKGYANYGALIPAIVEYGSVAAFQFHPEKSGSAGLMLLKNYVAEDSGSSGADCENGECGNGGDCGHVSAAASGAGSTPRAAGSSGADCGNGDCEGRKSC